ncbi:type II toxin-antitoxin system RatA family toxin [Candidatus Contendibacter odensensis]|uniref:Cyclase/dehydrase n=1 Tax=Candidatus Contendobacter odensis Run_B_J11 TaxID=1400861 RepID=A0A7U7G938_9GAMM|nr:type II toxin-antitoxin system RatA family toxin [Candidatus Contendobacter odensis]CDH44177.1 Cyclase/dehydrase [Candidatus Contendobacter odensis Run_B_J11]
MLTPYRASRVVAVSGEQIFDLVADVERYPEFLPLMRKALIIRRDPRSYETQQTLALGLMIYRFRTRTELNRPHSIRVTSTDWAFRRFEIGWSFTPTPDGQCRVDFVLDCEIRALWLNPFGEVLVAQMGLTMVDAFVTRAHQLNPTSSLS